MKLKSINPYTGNELESFEEFSASQIFEKINDAQNAFLEWKYTSFDFRKSKMLKVAELLKKNKETLGKTISDEMGKPIKQAVAEVEKCAWVCTHYANDAEMLLHKEALATDAFKSYIAYEPLGVILGIMPWNFPFWQVFRFAAPTLMAGNVVVLKHASNVQRCARAIENVFREAGFGNAFLNLTLSSSKVKSLIEDKRIKAITLTGSVEAGQKVATQAGACLKKTVLELGGNNAFIVLPDADLDKAVEIGLQARIINAGQNCIAAKRFIVHESLHQKFVDRMVTKISELKIGNPLHNDTDLGPMSSIEQARMVQQQVEDSVKMGARLVTGGQVKGAFFPATVITDVTPDMPLFNEEVFGPVAAITSYNTIDEAVLLANDSQFGLGVSIFTSNLEEGEKLVPMFEDGAVFINDMVKSDPRLPFGGTKQSGYGRELSVYGIREFVNIKTVYEQKFESTQIKSIKNTRKQVISTGKV